MALSHRIPKFNAFKTKFPHSLNLMISLKFIISFNTDFKINGLTEILHMRLQIIPLAKTATLPPTNDRESNNIDCILGQKDHYIYLDHLESTNPPCHLVICIRHETFCRRATRAHVHNHCELQRQLNEKDLAYPAICKPKVFYFSKNYQTMSR